eukprot:14330367-Alexandrium_andersonii.AAC.1
MCIRDSSAPCHALQIALPRALSALPRAPSRLATRSERWPSSSAGAAKLRRFRFDVVRGYVALGVGRIWSRCG